MHDSLAKIPLTPPEIPSSASEPPSTAGTGATTPAITNRTEADKDAENEDLDDKSTANTRSPRLSDGLPTALELVELFKAEFPLINGDGYQHEGAKSAYGSTQWKQGKGIDGFNDRKGFEDGEKVNGGNEPGWTCFTPLFRLTLGKSTVTLTVSFLLVTERTLFIRLSPRLTSCQSFVFSHYLQHLFRFRHFWRRDTKSHATSQSLRSW